MSENLNPSIPTEQNSTSTMSKIPLITPREKPTMENIPNEILVKILGHVHSDPQEPNFYVADSNGKYKNYLSAWFVNKKLSAATDQAIRDAKDLVIVTSNFKLLAVRLFFHGIPIVSDHALHTVKCHVMRIHVKVPQQESDEVACSILMRHADLEGLATVLRVLSLDKKFVRDPPKRANNLIHRYDTFCLAVEPLVMDIHLESFDGTELSSETKCSLISPLKIANQIGKITIFGSNDAVVSELLPGRHEYVHPRYDINGVLDMNLPQEEWLEWARDRERDGEDTLPLIFMFLKLGHAALENGNPDLALHHYDLAELLRQSLDTIPYLHDRYWNWGGWGTGLKNMASLPLLSLCRIVECLTIVGEIDSAEHLVWEASCVVIVPYEDDTGEERDYIHRLNERLGECGEDESDNGWRGRWPEAWNCGSPGDSIGKRFLQDW